MRRRGAIYTTVPFNTTEEWLGIPVRHVLLPPMVGAASLHVGQLFGLWIEPLVNHSISSPYQDLERVPYGPNMEHFMKAQPDGIDTEESLVRLLYWLGAAHGTTLEVTDDSIYVVSPGEKFGINPDGTLRSEYFLQLNCARVKAALAKVLTPTECTTSDRYFISLLVAVRRLATNKNAVAMEQAFVALMHCDDRFTYKNFFNRLKPVYKLSGLVLRKAESIIMEERDPVMKLYYFLVPHHIPRALFIEAFGLLRGRQIDPTLRQRARLVERLGQFLWSLTNQFEFGD